MTVSAFAAVSLEPPLVSVCLDERAETRAAVVETGVFAVNVLAVGQEELAQRFSQEGNEEQRFQNLAWRAGATGAPLLCAALVNLDCHVIAIHDAGDHALCIGRVEALEMRPGEPLVYCDGSYCLLTATRGTRG